MIFVAKMAFGQENFSVSTLKTSSALGYMTKVPSKGTLPKSIIPSNFYTSKLGFFCKQELKFEAITKIPFKFRLGSVQYCDWLEGKKLP